MSRRALVQSGRVAESLAVVASGGSPGASEDVPLGERADQRGVVRGSAGELSFEPGPDAFEIFVALGEHSAVDEGLTQVTNRPSGFRRLVSSRWLVIDCPREASVASSLALLLLLIHCTALSCH